MGMKMGQKKNAFQTALSSQLYCMLPDVLVYARWKNSHRQWLKATLLGKVITSLGLECGQTFVKHAKDLGASYRPLPFSTRMLWKAGVKSTQWGFSIPSHFMVMFVIYRHFKRLKGTAWKQSRIRVYALAGHIQFFHERRNHVKHLQLVFLLANCLW